MIRLQKINHEKVKPIKINNLANDNRKWKGHKLFENNLSNIFLCARKKSGKTSTIYKILKDCANRDTNIIVFSSTCYKDSNYIAMKKYFKNKEIPFICNESLIDEDKANLLENFLNEIKVNNKDESDSEDEEKEEDKYINDLQVSMFGRGINEDEEEPSKKKSKYKTPNYIFVLDDISTELKNKAVIKLLKQNRHYNAMVLISSQYMNDLDPQSRRQLDYLILFKGHRPDKLEIIYKDTDLSIEYETFLDLYKNATEKPFNFLYVDIRNDEYRRNFNYKYIIDENK
jgi:hypothetical protein